MHQAIQHRLYPSLTRRYQAFIIDGVIMYAAFMASAYLVMMLDMSGVARISIVAGIVFAIDPLLVSTSGASIGHHLRGLRIEKAERHQNINIIQSLVRFLIKYLFGWLSLIFILTTKKHQALHDFVSKSVVVVKKPADFHKDDLFGERTAHVTGHILPSAKRRLFIICVCLVGSFLTAVITVNLYVELQCMDSDLCSNSDEILLRIIFYLWFASIAVIVVMGWRGLLWGSKRRLESETI